MKKLSISPETWAGMIQLFFYFGALDKTISIIFYKDSQKSKRMRVAVPEQEAISSATRANE